MTSTPRVAVGFIGLGDQGLPMAIAIAEAGFPLHAWARRPASLEALAGVPHLSHDGLAGLATDSDVVCLCVSTDDDVMGLLKGGLLANMRPGSIVVNHGTGTPGKATLMAETCAAAGVEFLDAPVSGGHAGAVSRTLTTMIGGPEAAARTCEPIFRSFSGHVARLGGHGTGELAKLLNNTLMMMNHANIADILELATQLKVDPVALAEVIKTGSGSSAALELLPTGATGLPAEVVDHAKDVLLRDMELFDTAMHEYQTGTISTRAISQRAISGANRVPNSLNILNP